MAIDVVAEEVASNLEEIAQVTRRISSKGVGIFLGGLVVGAAVGFYFGHRWNKEKLRLEAFKESEIEVEKLRAFYQAKTTASDAKPDLEKVIEERGYSSTVEETRRPLRAPVPVTESRSFVDDVRGDLPEETVVESVRVVYGPWNYPQELESRSVEAPYVIHEDEFHDPEFEYDHVSYTYFAADDVLMDDADNHPVTHPDITVGVDNLKFGYGSSDPDTVFVRNDRLSLEMEITRSPGSYEEEVMGLQRDEPT